VRRLICQGLRSTSRVEVMAARELDGASWADVGKRARHDTPSRTRALPNRTRRLPLTLVQGALDEVGARAQSVTRRHGHCGPARHSTAHRECHPSSAGRAFWDTRGERRGRASGATPQKPQAGLEVSENRGSGRPRTSSPSMTSSAPSTPACPASGAAPMLTTKRRSRLGPPKVTSVGFATGSATVRSRRPSEKRASWLCCVGLD